MSTLQIGNHMHTVNDVEDLPAPEPFTNESLGYIRSITDHSVLVATKSGECFARRDGEAWDQPGYWTKRNGERPVGSSPGKEGKVTRESTTAYGDVGHVPKKIAAKRRAS